ncbi:MAG: hypothetical protein ACYTG5_14795 [Planctomycetota bacterium]|jgi:hypothetical protein
MAFRIGILVLLLITITSYRWHWSAGIEYGNDQLRLETQRGEIALSIWRGTDEYFMDAPLYWAHDADARTRLSDAAMRIRAGIGWKGDDGRYRRGARSFGVVTPWYYLLIGLLLAAGSWHLSALAWRRIR